MIGVKGIAISNALGTADTPRAHVMNPYAIGMRQKHPTPQLLIWSECLRDIGTEDEVRRMAVTNDEFRSMRWCRSMVGEEYGKVFCWGGHPDTKVRYYNMVRSSMLLI